ncbi:nucleotide-binding universal stress UspA family protein [Actinoplanes teichomyceticus]|uniref:Nucleotide-binding universal stress UspA family protein n=1 Tax=Actinoplanes teichomyceticus TaxID=1867 RepID=A0A561VI81_ACTTI|nr:nucleotide-binding universal stress UspA family protein [Actinoplanes teichomyceticus]
MSREHRTVVVGVDGSTTSKVAVDLAVAEAGRRSARLLIVHAWPGSYRGRSRATGVHRAEAEGSRVLAAAAQHAAAADPTLVVETELRPGVPGEALAACAEGAGLLVVGHRDSQVSRADWGSTTSRLARLCPCPLLVHRGRAGLPGPVVVGVSGRPAEPALGYAFVQAALTGADLIAVHAWRQPPERRNRHPFPIGGADPRRRAMAESLAAALAEWSWRLPQVAVQSLLVPDVDARYTLQRASRRSRLLVAGAGGRGELTELIGASLDRAGGQHGVCPVLLVPPGWPVALPGSPRATAGRITG